MALGLHDHEGLCAKATLQLFRSKLNLHDRGRALLARSVRVCREAGVLKSRRVRAAIDTSPILGRGAVKDTYNLVADGVAKLLRAVVDYLVACGCEESLPTFAQEHDLSRYVSAPSIKGAADFDWADVRERREFLAGLVSDTRRAIRVAREQLNDREATADTAQERERVEGAIRTLEQLLIQDVEEDDGGRPQIKRCFPFPPLRDVSARPRVDRQVIPLRFYCTYAHEPGPGEDANLERVTRRKSRNDGVSCW